MITVVASYRQNVHAYPSGGGDYEVATVNLGSKFGLTVASALLVDYVLTVAVSISSGVDALGDIWGYVGDHRVVFAVGLIAVLTAVNLRGIREAGTAFAVPTYAFIVAMVVMIAWGVFRIYALGDDLKAPSSTMTIKPEHGLVVGTSFAFVFLMVRAFSS